MGKSLAAPSLSSVGRVFPSTIHFWRKKRMPTHKRERKKARDLLTQRIVDCRSSCFPLKILYFYSSLEGMSASSRSLFARWSMKRNFYHRSLVVPASSHNDINISCQTHTKKFGGLAKLLKRKKRREKQDTMERKRISSCVKKHEKQKRSGNGYFGKINIRSLSCCAKEPCVCVCVRLPPTALEIAPEK